MMPRYRSRSVSARTVASGPLTQPLQSTEFVDGYQPAVDDPDLLQVVQGTTSSFRLNEVGYPRAQHVPGHNSDGLFRTIETVGASGHPFEHQNADRTTEIFSVDGHTGALNRFRQEMTSLQVVGPADGRHADVPAGVAMHASSMWAAGPDPSVYGAKALTIFPDLATLNRALPSQELWAAKFLCNADCTIGTLAFRIRTATAVVGVADYNGVAIYDDGATMNLLAASADDTALFQTTGHKTKALSSPVDLQAGKFYWFAMLARWTGTTLEVSTTPSTVAAGTANAFPGGNTTLLITGQSAFPSTITKASQTANLVRPLIAGY